MGRIPRYCIPSFLEIDLPVPEKILDVFTIYGHGDCLGQVTSILSTNFDFDVFKAYIQNLVKNGLIIAEKSKFYFSYLSGLGSRSKLTFTFNSHISS